MTSYVSGHVAERSGSNSLFLRSICLQVDLDSNGANGGRRFRAVPPFFHHNFSCHQGDTPFSSRTTSFACVVKLGSIKLTSQN